MNQARRKKLTALRGQLEELKARLEVSLPIHYRVPDQVFFLKGRWRVTFAGALDAQEFVTNWPAQVRLMLLESGFLELNELGVAITRQEVYHG